MAHDLVCDNKPKLKPCPIGNEATHVLKGQPLAFGPYALGSCLCKEFGTVGRVCSLLPEVAGEVFWAGRPLYQSLLMVARLHSYRSMVRAAREWSISGTDQRYTLLASGLLYLGCLFSRCSLFVMAVDTGCEWSW